MISARGHPVTIDGIYGPETTAAVQVFQAQKKLAQDRFVSDRIWEALVSGRQPG